MSRNRALHWVFKVSNRRESITFFREILGMKILRHEEFSEGCDAQCNGPFDGKWSKTMVGYGPEDTHFVMELTYNYNIGGYKLGNDLQGIIIQSTEAIERAKQFKWDMEVKIIFFSLLFSNAYLNPYNLSTSGARRQVYRESSRWIQDCSGK